MSNQSQYKAMMGEVHASADLIGKVKGIPMEKTKKRGMALKFATATCAALLGVFVVTNGVCYAATGETWVEKVTVWINGEPVEMDVQMSQNGDTTVGEVSYEVGDGEGGAVQMTMISEGATSTAPPTRFTTTRWKAPRTARRTPTIWCWNPPTATWF